MEIPNIIAQNNLSSESSIPPDVSLPAEPSDISSIVPSGEPSEVVPPLTEALGSKIAEAHEESQMPSTSAQEDAVQTSDMQMENMGYDQVS